MDALAMFKGTKRLPIGNMTNIQTMQRDFNTRAGKASTTILMTCEEPIKLLIKNL
jgi:hypothetical protein